MKSDVDLESKMREVPHKPGVYVMRDRFHRVIYVGKARDLRRRLSNYFSPSRRFAADLKTQALIRSICDFEWHVVRSDAEAVLYEGRLIKDFRPKYNVSFRDDKRFLLVRVHLDDPFPSFQLTRLRKEDGARYFGPFAHSGALRSTIRMLRKKYGIRTCRPKIPTEDDFKHCLDHVVQNCSAPCIGRISQADYKRRVLEACEFLEGQSHEIISQVETEMRKAAEKLDFEKAAQLRNLWRDLKETTRPVRRFTKTSLPTTIDPEADLKALQDALSLPESPEVMECFDISNISSTHVVASMVRFKNGIPDRSNYRRYRIRTVEGQDDFASMAEVVRRRYARILHEGVTVMGKEAEMTQEGSFEAMKRLKASGALGIHLPDLIIVDGGKGQLSMASKELQKLGLSEVPLIGLAKEFEEIYRPGRPLPLQLPEDSGALRLLQRIRDEAHRVANGYHSLLLRRRMRESLLDDIPGVSTGRKKQLLKKFGSVSRLRKASVEEVAEVVDRNLAETILHRLQAK